uniref:Uncharacterized protein n=1 Tax=Megaselia scalaris TaxID=36166 RepID=T1GHY7_MEGSC
MDKLSAPIVQNRSLYMDLDDESIKLEGPGETMSTKRNLPEGSSLKNKIIDYLFGPGTEFLYQLF